MAEKEEVLPSFGNFTIHDTMEMAGNQELLDNIFAPEISTDPNNIQKIEKKTTVSETTTKKVEKEPKKEEIKDKTLEEELLEEEIETPNEEKKEEKKEEEQSNTFNVLSKDLFKLGVFAKDEEEETEPEINTPEDFLERFNYEKKKGASEIVEKFIAQFGESHQKAFEAIYVNGVDPKEYFGIYNNLQNVAEMDMSIEANQEAVVRQTLTDQGLESEDITSEIEKIKQYGDLADKAQKFHKILIKKNTAKLEQVEAESQKKLMQQAAVKQQYSTNVTTVLQNKLKTGDFDGIQINGKLAAELQDFLITEKYKTPSGETLTEFDRTILDLKRPENHERKVKIGLLLKILEKDPTLSTIQQTGITKKTNTLFSEVKKQASKSSVKSDNKSDSSTWNSL